MPAKNFIIKLTLFLLLYSRTTSEFAHWLFTDLPNVKGRVKPVADSTKYFLTVDSLVITELWIEQTDYNEDGKTHDNDFSSARNFNDPNGADFMFGITGKLSREKLMDQDSLYHFQRSNTLIIRNITWKKITCHWEMGKHFYDTNFVIPESVPFLNSKI